MEANFGNSWILTSKSASTNDSTDCWRAVSAWRRCLRREAQLSRRSWRSTTRATTAPAAAATMIMFTIGEPRQPFEYNVFKIAGNSSYLWLSLGTLLALCFGGESEGFERFSQKHFLSRIFVSIRIRRILASYEKTFCKIFTRNSLTGWLYALNGQISTILFPSTTSCSVEQLFIVDL